MNQYSLSSDFAMNPPNYTNPCHNALFCPEIIMALSDALLKP